MKSSASLRLKSLIIVLCTMAALVLVLYFIGRAILQNSFIQIEQANTIDTTQRLLRLLQDRQASLKALAKDYAAWDDTYRFVVTHDPEYIKSTMVETTFQNTKLNLFEIWDASNHQVISRSFDLDKGVFQDRPRSLDKYLRGSSSLLGHSSVDGEKHGLALLETGIMMIASLPITTSNNEGPIRGTLMMGRYFDQKAIENISAIMGSKVELHLASGPLAKSLKRLPSNSEPVLTDQLGPHSIAGYAVLKDVADKPSVLVKISMPRPVWQEAQGAMTILRYSLVATILAAGLITFLIWERMILARLSQLSTRLAAVGASGDLSTRLSWDGRDELAKLASDIDGMLQLLENAENRYKELFNSISDLICIHDLEGRLITLNYAAQKSAGLPVQALVGRNLVEFIPPKFRQAFKEDYLEVIKEKKYCEGVTSFLDKDGNPIYLEYRNRLLEELGEEAFVIGSARDVTQRIKSEREMKRLEEQIFRSQKLEAIGVLAGGIAHDFNNVLQSISSNAQLLQKESGLTIQGKERLEYIDQTVERAARMINQLMTFARKLEPRRELFDFNKEVSQTLEILKFTLPKMIRIRTDLDPYLKPFNGDPGQMEQLLLNLATNAGHAMPDGGELFISTKGLTLQEEDCKQLPGLSPGEYLQVKMSDTGTGMDEETKAHIFEPFFTTKTPGKGTGLGLSTVYGIISNHGGQIFCQSELNRGTEFTVYLPTAPSEGHPTHGQSQIIPPKNLAGVETILLADDEPYILEAGREALESFGYQVLTAMRGEDALEVFLKNSETISLIIMDLNMPGMGGLESMTAILVAHPEARILVATGYAEAGLEEKIREIGGIGIVNKPYSFSSLLVKIRNILDQ